MHLSHRTCFFLYRPAHPRDLHPFPTRRSSDLSWHCAPRAFHTCHRHGFWKGHTPPGQSWGGPVEEMEDRKSTRLNSSHPSISYAVFCLKKKNTTTHHTHVHTLSTIHTLTLITT